METTVAFPNKQSASEAAGRLVNAGFPPDHIRVVNASTPDRQDFIEKKTSDTKRAFTLGVLFGAVGGILGGVALSGVFAVGQSSVIGGLAGAAGGALLGLGVGRATTTQVRNELTRRVEAGTVLVSVTSDSETQPSVLELLAKGGETSLVSTTGSFTAGELPATPKKAQQTIATKKP